MSQAVYLPGAAAAAQQQAKDADRALRESELQVTTGAACQKTHTWVHKSLVTGEACPHTQTWVHKVPGDRRDPAQVVNLRSTSIN